jgi:hypothetical protein
LLLTCGQVYAVFLVPHLVSKSLTILETLPLLPTPILLVKLGNPYLLNESWSKVLMLVMLQIVTPLLAFAFSLVTLIILCKNIGHISSLRGWFTFGHKMAPSLVRLYEQMPKPKYVIAMGACIITGGMFSTNSYSTIRGVDKLIPVDVYLPSYPPKLEAVIDAITKLRKKLSREIYEDQIRSQ